MHQSKSDPHEGAATGQNNQRLLVVGEVLWDVFENGTFLGGAPLNFAAHASRLGHQPILISAVGNDPLGERARHQIRTLGLDTTFLCTTDQHPTGTASVEFGASSQPRFVIRRPAAYDAVEISTEAIHRLAGYLPDWLYYGTLFPSLPAGKATLLRLIESFPSTARLYDVNLRPGFDAAALVRELITLASVVKLNETEVVTVAGFLGLPEEVEAFCRAGQRRYGWTAACVTLGERGCAMLVGDEFVRSPAPLVQVADTVGAGDAFAAAFIHGLSKHWEAPEIAAFANRVGALVASRPGGIPDWSIAEVSTERTDSKEQKR